MTLFATPRRTFAVVATAAAVGSVALVPMARAASEPASSSTRGPLDGLLGTILSLTPPQLEAQLEPLTSGEIGDLLGGANVPQADVLLDVLTPAQLQGALSTVDPAALTVLVSGLEGGDLTGVLDSLDPTTLTNVLGGLDPAILAETLGDLSGGDLSPALAVLGAGDLAPVLALLDGAGLTGIVGTLTPPQITSLLGQSGSLPDVVTGLAGVATGLLGGGGTPSPAAVDALVKQVNALLGTAGLPIDPAQLTQLNGLLGQLTSLVGVAGVDKLGLTDLLGTVDSLLTGATAGTPLAGLGGALNGVLGVTSGGGGSGTGTGGTTTKPGATGTTSANRAVTGARFTKFRARVISVKVAKNRKTARVTLRCSANAPACVVVLTGKVGGKRAFKLSWAGISAAGTKTVKVTFLGSAVKRLVKKGGAVKLTAATVGSSLGAATASKSVKRG